MCVSPPIQLKTLNEGDYPELNCLFGDPLLGGQPRGVLTGGLNWRDLLVHTIRRNHNLGDLADVA